MAGESIPQSDEIPGDGQNPSDALRIEITSGNDVVRVLGNVLKSARISTGRIGGDNTFVQHEGLVDERRGNGVKSSAETLGDGQRPVVKPLELCFLSRVRCRFKDIPPTCSNTKAKSSELRLSNDQLGLGDGKFMGVAIPGTSGTHVSVAVDSRKVTRGDAGNTASLIPRQMPMEEAGESLPGGKTTWSCSTAAMIRGPLTALPGSHGGTEVKSPSE